MAIAQARMANSRNLNDIIMENRITTIERNMQSRTELLLGVENLNKIQQAKVLIFGVGGVGSWCAESLVRSGVRNLTIVDSDRISITNCNRQLMATSKTLGQVKVEALRERLLEINPNANIVCLEKIYEAETAESFHLEEYDYIVDAIDSLKDKADLILRATAMPKHITFISSMGAALRRDPFMVRKTEFWKVKGDPLARAIRKKFKHQKVYPSRKFECVYSEEKPMQNLGVNNGATADEFQTEDRWSATKAQINGSLCHVTAVFGNAIASMIINNIIDRNGKLE